MKQIAVVTGASSGMGREFVKQLEEYVQVDEIWVIARRRDALESLQGEVKTRVIPLCLDLCQGVREYEDLLQRETPNVRLLVNAAGFGKFGASWEIPVEDECRMIDLNCKALVQMTRATIPYMAPGGHILELDSLSAFQPVPYITTYAATKSFVLSYSRAMNRELREKGIRVMAMNPGWVKTEFFRHATVTDGNSRVRYFNRLFDARDVVKTGLRDLYRSKKDYSVHGLSIRWQVRAVKLLPHSLIMDIWLRQQKKEKNSSVLRPPQNR